MAPRQTTSRGRRRPPSAALPVGLAVLVATLVLTPRPGASQAPSADVCSRVRPGEVVGRVADTALDELSGLAASRVHPGVLWAIEDSGSPAALVALDATGADLGTHLVRGATNTDWEDLAAGPGPDPDRSYLYIGDIGDNRSARPAVTVYRVPEPEGAPTDDGRPLTGAEALRFTYPDGPADAEALLVDPVTGDLVIVTKEIDGRSTVLHAAAAALRPGRPITLEEAGEIDVPGPRLTLDNAALLPGTLVTGGDVAPAGDVVVLRTYRSVLAYQRPDGMPLADALLGDPCFARQTNEPQGEAIAFAADGRSYTTVSEVQLARQAGAAPATEGPELHRFALTDPGSPPVDAPPGPGEQPGGIPWWVVPVGGVALAAVTVLIVVALWVRRRRRRS